MATDADYRLAVTKGTKLLDLLLADDAGAGLLLHPTRSSAKSLFTCADDFQPCGYIQHHADPAETRRHLQSLVPALKALGLDSKLAYDGGHNIRVNHSLPTRPYYDEDPEDITNAGFAQICNPVDGVLIAYANFNKVNGRRASTFSYLHRWSDVAYLQYLSASASFALPSTINYVFRLGILHPGTRAILDRIMNVHNSGDYNAWPGITFDADSEAWKAILGTVHGAGVAWMLIQRKAEFGDRRIGGVTIFWADNEEDEWPWPSLLFRIV